MVLRLKMAQKEPCGKYNRMASRKSGIIINNNSSVTRKRHRINQNGGLNGFIQAQPRSVL